jgi:hypothetical protein
MIRPIEIAAAILVLSAAPVFAQAGNPPPAPQATPPSMVVGPTGTMYDGNNADLQLPSEQKAYWAQLWAEPGAAGNASAVGAGTAGTPGGAQTGGQR